MVQKSPCQIGLRVKRHRSLPLIQEAGRGNQRCWLISSFEVKKINGAKNRSSSYFSSRRTVINWDGTFGKLWSTDLRVSGSKPLPGWWYVVLVPWHCIKALVLLPYCRLCQPSVYAAMVLKKSSFLVHNLRDLFARH